MDESRLHHDRVVSCGGVTLHVVRAGEGPLVVLLHGFPEFWYSWRHQIGPLVDAGFSVAAPDLRGYNLSDRPGDVGAYGLRRRVRPASARRGRGSGHPVDRRWTRTWSDTTGAA